MSPISSVNDRLARQRENPGGQAATMELEARIQRIREQNARREQRHKEVEEDRQEAIQKEAAVVNHKGKSPLSGTWDDGHAFRNPYQSSSPSSSSTPSGRPARGPLRRPGAPPQRTTQEEAETTTTTPTRPKTSVHQRLGNKDAPPPDPGYSFLADRFRDNDNDSLNGDRGRRRPSGGRGRGRGAGAGQRGRRDARSNRGSNEWDQQDTREYRRRNDENLSPKHTASYSGKSSRRSSIDWSEERVGSVLKEIRHAHHSSGRASPAHSDAGQSRPPKMSSVQARLERARRGGGRGGHREAPHIDNSHEWYCADPGCQTLNRPGSNKCFRCSLPFQTTKHLVEDTGVAPGGAGGRRVKEDRKGIKVEVNFDRKDADPSEVALPDDPSTDWASQATSQEQQHFTQEPPVQQQQQQQQQWHPQVLSPQSSVETGITDWAEEVSKEIPHSPEVMPQHQNAPVDWGMTYIAPTPAAVVPAMLPPQPYVQIPVDPMTAAAAQYIQYPADPYQQLPHTQAFTQITSASHHNMPIMTTHPLEMSVPPPQPHHQQPQQHHQPQQYYQPPPSRHSSSYTPRSYESNNSYSYYDSGRGRGRGGSSWHNSGPTHNVTRIPQKFHKQRPQETSKQTVSSLSLPANLPKASSSARPESCNRLTVFCPSNLLSSNLSEDALKKELNVAARRINVNDVRDLFANIAKVDPALDRYVLVHLGASDALEVSKKDKSDVEKGADSDRLADSLCDAVEDLARRIPYAHVFVSMLCPRFDLIPQHQPTTSGMGLPNSVRRVMNVQIQMRLNDKERVTLVNNNQVLEWYEDEEKRDRLFKGDGLSLTEEGGRVMASHWLEHLKKEVKEDSVEEVSGKIDALSIQKEAQNAPLDDSVDESAGDEVVNVTSDSVDQEAVEDSKAVAVNGIAEEAKPEEESTPNASEAAQSTPKKESETSETKETPEESKAPEAASQPGAGSVLLQSPSRDERAKSWADEVSDESFADKSVEAEPAKESAAEAANVGLPSEDEAEEEFHEAEDGGYIEDSYCGSNDKASSEAAEVPPASLESVQSDEDGQPASGIFIEDPYVDASAKKDEFREKENEEKMEKELS